MSSDPTSPSSTSAPLPSLAPPSPHPPTVPIAAATSVVVVLLIGVALFFLIRHRRRSEAILSEELPSQSSVHHPASQITPFGSTLPESPRFAFSREPGANMRIAHRCSDGAWLFADPSDPFAPVGISELDIQPQPNYAASTYRNSLVRPSRRSAKEEESKARSSYKGEYELDPGAPPPAYGHDG
jgi:hypothetical protein